jgi:hypothetical protein
MASRMVSPTENLLAEMSVHKKVKRKVAQKGIGKAEHLDNQTVLHWADRLAAKSVFELVGK